MKSDEEAAGPYAPVELTPRDYEHLVASLFAKLGDDLDGLRIQHGERVEGVDGKYLIDTTIRFRALGEAEFLVLV